MLVNVNQSNFIHPTWRGGMRELFIQLTGLKFLKRRPKKSKQEKRGVLVQVVLSELFFFDPFTPRSGRRALSVLHFQRDFISSLFGFTFPFSQGCSSLAIYLSLLHTVILKEKSEKIGQVYKLYINLCHSPSWAGPLPYYFLTKLDSSHDLDSGQQGKFSG